MSVFAQVCYAWTFFVCCESACLYLCDFAVLSLQVFWQFVSARAISGCALNAAVKDVVAGASRCKNRLQESEPTQALPISVANMKAASAETYLQCHQLFDPSFNSYKYEKLRLEICPTSALSFW